MRCLCDAKRCNAMECNAMQEAMSEHTNEWPSRNDEIRCYRTDLLVAVAFVPSFPRFSLFIALSLSKNWIESTILNGQEMFAFFLMSSVILLCNVSVLFWSSHSILSLDAIIIIIILIYLYACRSGSFDRSAGTGNLQRRRNGHGRIPPRRNLQHGRSQTVRQLYLRHLR